MDKDRYIAPDIEIVTKMIRERKVGDKLHGLQKFKARLGSFLVIILVCGLQRKWKACPCVVFNADYAWRNQMMGMNFRVGVESVEFIVCIASANARTKTVERYKISPYSFNKFVFLNKI